jgi:hypothetical protein
VVGPNQDQTIQILAFSSFASHNARVVEYFKFLEFFKLIWHHEFEFIYLVFANPSGSRAKYRSYEYLTAFRDEKSVQPSLLLRTPQDPTEDGSMIESFVLTLYFNSLHVCFHLEGLEGHQPHLQRAYILVIISECGDELWGLCISTWNAPNDTGASIGLCFILQRRRVAWGATRLVSLLVMYSVHEKQRKHKYSKIIAGSAQNGDF